MGISDEYLDNPERYPVRITFTLESFDAARRRMCGKVSFFSEYNGNQECVVEVDITSVSFRGSNGAMLPEHMKDERVNKHTHDLVKTYFLALSSKAAYVWVV